MPTPHPSFSYEINGQPSQPLADLYHVLMRGSWLRILAFASLSYVVSIGGFAILFWLGGDCVEGARPDSILDDFWFSVQTFSTIGYGGMLPKTVYAHVLVTIESFVGLAGVAVVTALMYSRFSRPVARVGFADKAVVCQRNGIDTLQVRIANERQNQILDAHVRIHVLAEHTTAEGQTLSRLVPLQLDLEQTPIFSMTWTLIHRLDADSPLHGLTAATTAERLRFMMVSFVGTDDALVQTVYAQRIYTADDIAFGKVYRDMMTRRDDGGLVMHYPYISDVVDEPTG